MIIKTKKATNNIISLSGGKDSTAMLHWMIEHKEPIHSVIYFDSGWQHPAMTKHISLIEKKTGISVIRLKSEKPHEYYMFERRIKARSGPMKGRVHRIGYGWPSRNCRWCNRVMLDTFKKHIADIPDHITCIGIASDEAHRKRDERYPLIEYGKTSPDCLKYCKELGYHWDGLYDIFPRTSCYCCPLQSINSLRKLRKHFPKLWEQMLEWDMRMPSNNGFKDYSSLVDLEYQLAQEDKRRWNGDIRCPTCKSKCYAIKAWRCKECGNIEIDQFNKDRIRY